MFALIEAAFAEFRWMERDGHKDGVTEEVGEMWGFFEYAGEIFEAVKALMIFEGVKEASPRAFGEEEGFAFFEDGF